MMCGSRDLIKLHHCTWTFALDDGSNSSVHQVLIISMCSACAGLGQLGPKSPPEETIVFGAGNTKGGILYPCIHHIRSGQKSSNQDFKPSVRISSFLMLLMYSLGWVQC